MIKRKTDFAKWTNLKKVLDYLPESYYDEFSNLYLPYRSEETMQVQPQVLIGKSIAESFDGNIVEVNNDRHIVIVDGNNTRLGISLYNEDEVELTEEVEQLLAAWIFSEEV